MAKSKRPRPSERLQRSKFHVLNPVLDQFWIDSRLFLEESGYRLPPKFDPSWSPANEMEEMEASVRLPRWTLMSAVRIRDGLPVILKQVGVDSPELEISILFSSPPLSLNPRNHCISVIQVLEYDGVGVLVLPLLRKFDDLPFDTVGEVVECFRQIFEGIQFMHQNFVAHRDCTKLNIMLDPAKLYPEGLTTAAWFRQVALAPRVGHDTTLSTSVTLADMILRMEYLMNESYEEGINRPEHCNLDDLLYNPFPTDIYYLGNLLREYFLDTKEYCHPTRIGLEFLRPLVEDTVRKNPSDRPTIDDVVTRLDAIVKSLSLFRLQALTQLGDQTLFFPFTYVAQRLKFALVLRSSLPKISVAPSRVLSAARDFYTSKRQKIAVVTK